MKPSTPKHTAVVRPSLDGRRSHAPEMTPPVLAEDSLAFSLSQAARVIAQVMVGQSLADGLLQKVPQIARPAVQDLAYSTLRQYGRGDFFLAQLMDRAPPAEEIHALLLVALLRLEQRPDAAHTVVDQAVAAAAQVGAGRFKGLVNGVLRNFLRQKEALLRAAASDALASQQHPEWWLRRLYREWPKAAMDIVAAGNQPPPMALRVNRRRGTRDAWLAQLIASGIGGRALGEDGVLLERPQPVERLPGFAEGLVSVQDFGAQKAAELLAPASGSRVLDACAAPGGKTAHLLEIADLNLLALDLKPTRCRRVEENLARLGLQATVKVGDCLLPEGWWDGRPFDAILADVPCTASGVVRRHPDAKWLRREADVASFARTQVAIVDALWQVLRPGGKLLYATCSVFAAENSAQMQAFLARTPDASRLHEIQYLPNSEHDGFYYCLLQKAA